MDVCYIGVGGGVGTGGRGETEVGLVVGSVATVHYCIWIPVCSIRFSTVLLDSEGLPVV